MNLRHLVALTVAGTPAVLGLWWLRRQYAVVDVGGWSMRPAYEGGERVLLRRSPPAPLRRGVVVVVEVPDLEDRWHWTQPPHGHRLRGRHWMIKRIAALAGDPTPDAFATAAGVAPNAPVPAGHLLVAGDNTGVSLDSREFGYVPVERVLGTVLRTIGSSA